MKKHTHSLRRLGFTTLSVLTAGTAFSQQQQPNIVLFMVDDMGWQDTSEPFWTERTPYNDLCHTPNMERLARQGVKFTQAYACAISSPSRTSLMTGMNAARHRVTNWTLNLNTSTDAGDATLAWPSWNYNGLQADNSPVVNNALNATTLAQILKNNGYYTIHTGKAHWGAKTTAGSDPLNLGFDVNVGGSAAGGPSSYYPIYTTTNYPIPGLEDYNVPSGINGVYLTEALTIEALKRLDERPNKSQPFYFYLSHYAVHVPITIDPRFQNNPKYAGYSGNELAYLTMVEGMDKSLGDVLNWLEANNQTQNTIVIFMSDNGGHSSIGNITKNGISYTHNYPLRGSKGSVFEGGIREPMIVKWPGVTTADTQTDVPVIIEDFFPSILEMAGVSDYTTTQTRDGVSFVPVLKREVTAGDPNREFYWHFPNKWGEYADGYDTYSAIRKGDYKLVYRWRASTFELYNIKEDIGERNNLLNSNDSASRALALELSGRLSDYLRSVDAQRPTNKTTGKIIVWPDEAPLPTAPVAPKISDATNEYWYKIHDNRSPNYFWQVDGNGRLNVATEAVANDTTTADKLYKLQIAPDGSGYQFFSMTDKTKPISATGTANNTNLYINATNPVNSWIYTPSAVVAGYYLIAAESDARQLNSYVSNGFVSFWMTADGDTDQGNRWAFTPGYLKPPLTSYPAMSRFFTNTTVPQEQAASRYLTLVETTINGIKNTQLSATTNPTDVSNIQTNVVVPGAVVDALTPQINILDGVTSFDLMCKGSTDNVRNLQYTQQNVFIDWNNDFDFLDAGEAGTVSNTTTSFTAHLTGYTRTIAIPAGKSPGIYRMRVIYNEPITATTDWSKSIWTDNIIRNGIAYDFELKLGNQTGVQSAEILQSKVRVLNGMISVDGITDFEVYAVDGRKVNRFQALPKGVYIVRTDAFSVKCIVK